MVCVLQINLHHSKAASAALLLQLSKGAADIALIQEPWVIGHRICGLKSAEHTLISGATIGKPRACILVSTKLKILFLPQFSDEDTTTISLEANGRQIRLASMYLAHDRPVPTLPVEHLVERWDGALILGGDANAHHSTWGSGDINERGESLLNSY